MSENQTEENVIALEDGVEYWAQIRITSTKGDDRLKIETTRGPTEFLDGADEESYVEVPISWTFAERLQELFSQVPRPRQEDPTSNVIDFPTSEAIN